MKYFTRLLFLLFVVASGGCATNGSLDGKRVSTFGQQALDLTIEQDVYGHPAEFVSLLYDDSSNIEEKEDYVTVNIKNQRKGRFDISPMQDHCEYNEFTYETWNNWLFCTDGGEVKFANHREEDQVRSSRFYKADSFVPYKDQYSSTLSRMYNQFTAGRNAYLEQRKIGQRKLRELQDEFLKMLARTRLVSTDVAVGQKACMYTDKSDIVVGFIEQIGERNVKFKPQFKYNYFLLAGVLPNSRYVLDYDARWLSAAELNICPERI